MPINSSAWTGHDTPPRMTAPPRPDRVGHWDAFMLGFMTPVTVALWCVVRWA